MPALKENEGGPTTFAPWSPLICLIKPLLTETSKAQSPHLGVIAPSPSSPAMLPDAPYLLSPSQKPGVLLPLPQLEAETAARAESLYL